MPQAMPPKAEGILQSRFQNPNRGGFPSGKAAFLPGKGRKADTEPNPKGKRVPEIPPPKGIEAPGHPDKTKRYEETC